MSNRKRKGSGRPKTAYPPYAVGPEQALELAMEMTEISDRNVRQMIMKKLESNIREPEPAAEEEKDEKIVIAPDRFSHEQGLNVAALRREFDMRGYYCFPIKAIRADAMIRLIKNTNCEYTEKTEGMLQLFRIKHGDAEAMIVIDRYSGVMNMMNTGRRMEEYDEFAKRLVNYFASAGIFKNYTCDIKVFLKDEADTDPLADYNLPYPAVWLKGALPDDIVYAEALSKWYKGLVHFYITPTAAGLMPRQAYIKNVYGEGNMLAMPLSDSDADYAALIIKAILDADRMYRSTLNASRTNSAYKINIPTGEDGIDIGSFPLFRKPDDSVTIVAGPFMTDEEGLKAMLDGAENGDKPGSASLSIEEIEDIKNQLEKELEERKKFELDLQKIVQEHNLYKTKAEKQIEELNKALDKRDQKLLEAEAIEKELKDKVAEYAGLLRDQKDTDEYEQILRAAEDENAELKKRCIELEAANEALKGNFETIKQKDVRGEALVVRGVEKDLFPGEVKDFILSAVEKELTASVPDTRRAHVMKDILDSNSYGHLLETKKGKLKAICEEYDGDLTAALPELEKEGYYLKSNNSHPKVEYYGDSRYVSVVSATASDHRSGLNQISDMSRMCL